MSYLKNNINILSDFELSSTIPITSNNITTGYKIKHTNGTTYDIGAMYKRHLSVPNIYDGRVDNPYTCIYNSIKYDIRKLLKCRYDKTFSKSIGTSGYVTQLVISGTDIYVGGDFTIVYDSAGPTFANRIAKYDTTTSLWSVLGSSAQTLNNTTNGVNNGVTSISISGTDIYVGGYFTQVYDSGGTTYANYIAKYNTTTLLWSVLGLSGTNANNTSNGTNTFVNSIVISGSDIYVGGSFTQVYSSAILYANGIAKYNNGWSILGSSGTSVNRTNGVIGTVYAIAILGTDIYVGGNFQVVRDTANIYASNIAKYNNGKWSVLGATATAANQKMNGTKYATSVNSIAVLGTDIYIGGNFTEVYNNNTILYANYIVKYNNGWSVLGSSGVNANNTLNGTNKEVYTISISGTDIYMWAFYSSI